MLNWIWSGMILVSVLCAAASGKMEALTHASMDSAKSAVELALSLIGAMAFWLGIMKIAEDAGLLNALARRIQPIMRRLFPDVPADHPAMSAMIMNIAANMLGLGNAATPFGIKAMTHLQRLNPKKAVATDAMCLFLAINTSHIALFPLGVIAVRAAAGSQNPASIFPTTLFATACATVVAIVAAKTLARLPHFKKQWDEYVATKEEVKEQAIDEATEVIIPQAKQIEHSAGIRIFSYLFFLAFFGLMGVYLVKGAQKGALAGSLREVMSFWLLPGLIAGFLMYGILRGVKIYESLVEGAKEGFQVSIRIIPFLVAILVAVGMFRASGAMDLLISIVEPATSLIGLPGEALPMALIRPLSGSGAFAVMSEITTTHGPDSFIANLVGTFQGSTETTFYVLAVYFGAVRVKVVRHAIAVGLIADAVAILASVWICRLLLT